MGKFKRSLVASVMGVIMGITLIGSSVAFADPPCSHSYGVHLEQVCYHSSTVGSHLLSDGRTCFLFEKLYHNYGCCNRCGFRMYTYDDTTVVEHSILHS